MRVVAQVIALFLTSTAWAVEVPQPEPMSAPVFEGSVAVGALSGKAYSLRVDSELMTEPTIEGRVTAIGGTGNDIVVLVLSETDYINWKNNHSVSAIYSSGQVTVAELAVPLSKAGTYYVVFSNLFSGITPKTVTGRIDLKWTRMPTAAELAAAEELAMLERETAKGKQQERIAVTVLVVLSLALGTGGAIAWIAATRKKKGSTTKAS